MRRISGMTKTEVLVGLIVAVCVFTGIIVLVRFDITGKKGSGLAKEFVYDIEDRIKIDPNLILYAESSKPITTGFSISHGIATDSNGIIYAAGDEAVRLFDGNGNLRGEIELGDTARCLTVAEDDKVYIGMKNYVRVYDPRTKRLTDWQLLNDNAVLTSIAVVKNDVFVADAGNRIVLHYDTDGKLINRIGAKNKDRNIPGLVVPSPYFDIAVAADGLLRVVNPGRHRIEAYTFDGDLEFWWGNYSPDIEGFCGCCNPVNFIILADGSVVTCEKGLVRVKVYSPEGQFTGVVAGPEQLIEGKQSKICQLPANCQSGGFDLAVDKQQRILVLDTINNVIRIFTKIRQNSG